MTGTHEAGCDELVFKKSAMSNALTRQKLAGYLADGYPIAIGRGSYGGPKLYWSKSALSHKLKI